MLGGLSQCGVGRFVIGGVGCWAVCHRMVLDVGRFVIGRC